MGLFYPLDELDAQGFLRISSTAPSVVTGATGWTVATVDVDRYSDMAARTERAAGTFGATVLPNSGPSSGNACRTGQLYGVISASVSVTAKVIAVTQGGLQSGALRYTLWKGAAADGSDATEIASVVQGANFTNLTTSTAQNSNALLTTGEQTFNGEYVFLRVALRNAILEMTAGCDVLLRHGSGEFELNFGNGLSESPIAPDEMLGAQCGV